MGGVIGYRGPGIKMARGKWLIPHAILLLQVARLMARPPARAHAAPGTSVKSEIVAKVKQGVFSTKKVLMVLMYLLLAPFGLSYTPTTNTYLGVKMENVAPPGG